MDTYRRRVEETIRLDPEGNWYYGAYPVLHDRTIQFLHKNIQLDDEGRFYLSGEDKPVFFKVEDVPFVITKIERTIAGYLITLTDQSIELLDPTTLWVGKKNALYCLVKGGQMAARFSRMTYYEIAKDISGDKRFHLTVAGKKYAIQTTPPKQWIAQNNKTRKKARATERKNQARKTRSKVARARTTQPKKAAKEKKR